MELPNIIYICSNTILRMLWQKWETKEFLVTLSKLLHMIIKYSYVVYDD